VTQLINLTPHPVRIVGPDNELIAQLPGAALPARRTEQTRQVGLLALGGTSVPLLTVRYGPIHDLPGPQPNVVYVVSRLVADACPGRDDLVVPADLVRDPDGTPIGCRALARSRADHDGGS
jgi:hypothetical protein